ncbi:hypothetical protein [Endozoicomonas sp. SCSIO W0465]|nr:hypothetical protein [Endozoicomonas sp. SCSIO W0465]
MLKLIRLELQLEKMHRLNTTQMLALILLASYANAQGGLSYR